MHVSVIIPCLNAEKTISVQLDALQRQDYDGSWEIIVSDNGSTDNTLTILDRYKKQIPNLIVVDSSGRKGAAHSRNVGSKTARGDILLFCDADDMVEKSWVSSMARALKKHKFVAGSLREGAFPNQKFSKARNIPQQNGLQKYDYPPFLNHAGGGNLGIKKEIHYSVGGFDESLRRLQDTDYCWRVQLSGIILYYEPDAIIYMRLRDSWKGALRQKWEWGSYNVLLYKKYRPFGMPELNWRTSLETWIKLITRVPRIRSRSVFNKWLIQVAWKLGRLEGCIKYRVLAL